MPTLLHTVAIQGRVRIVTRRRADQAILTDSGWHTNTVTNAALAAMVQWLTGTGNIGYAAAPYPNYVELGTGSGTPEPTDTALFAPVAVTNTRVAILQPAADNPAQAEWIVAFPASAPAGSYTEAGLFTADGTLFAHVAGLTIELSASTTTSLQWVWTLSVG